MGTFSAWRAWWDSQRRRVVRSGMGQRHAVMGLIVEVQWDCLERVGSAEGWAAWATADLR